MPEEVNRILTDHCSDLLFCPTYIAVRNLKNEGITNNVYKTGDTMYEIAFMIEDKVNAMPQHENIPDEYILSTIHRAENTIDEKLPKIMDELGELDLPVVLPLHPRTRNKLKALNLLEKVKEDITIIEPVGFFEFSKLLKDSKAVITDSGGIQKEAYWHKKPCVTVRDQTEWLETIEAGGNILANPDEIKEKLAIMLSKEISFNEDLYGYKDTSSRIVKILETIEK